MTLANPQIIFERFLIREYLRLGSINKVFKFHKYNLPISFAGYDRLLNKYKVVKSAGPNSKLSESLYILSQLANYKISLEKIYHRYIPRSIQVSTNTLHRILHYVRLGLTRRRGVALLISPANSPQKILLGKDMSLSGTVLGNKGDYSLPMGHSKTGEDITISIARVLQNEVFTEKVIDRTFPWEVIPQHPIPIMYINIADIQVAVYQIFLQPNHSKFSSFKLSQMRYHDSDNLPSDNFRPGVKEIIKKYLDDRPSPQSFVINSEINDLLYALAEEQTK